MTCVIDGRLKEAAEVIERERALKAIVEVTAKEKVKAAMASERKAIDVKKAWLAVESKLTNVETKLDEAELKLATINSLNLPKQTRLLI